MTLAPMTGSPCASVTVPVTLLCAMATVEQTTISVSQNSLCHLAAPFLTLVFLVCSI
jgi:hypothetical protein